MINSITQSMMGMFLRCPAQFERRYVNGEIIPPGIAARQGSAVHQAAFINHLQKKETRLDLPLGDLQDAARDEYLRLVKEEGVFIPKDSLAEKDKLLGTGLDVSVKLTKTYRESLAPRIQPILVEKRLIADVGLDLPVSGGIDAYTEDKWLPDLKTAGKSKSQGEADNSLQLTMYAGLVNNLTGEWPRRISLEILVNTKEPKHQSLETTRGLAEWENLLLRLKLMIAQLKTGLFPPCDPGAWICSPAYCGYFWTCKYSLKNRS